MRRLALTALAALVLAPAALATPPQADLRFATFNASLNRSTAGQMKADLDSGTNAQMKAVAEIIQRTRPDVLLVNEFDYDPAAPAVFKERYLEVPQNGAAPIHYPYHFIDESNTGMPSGFDLNNNGVSNAPLGTFAYADDAWGFGQFPGQFGMLVLSRYPIDAAAVRTFRQFLWKDMPGNLMPPGWYSPAETAGFPLSSKSHWDVPILVGEKTVHFLVSHPTPPVFDGAEDRNGRRNYDEIRFWADYITPARSGYIYDDDGGHGGLKPGELFVVAGDQNSDPVDGDSIPGSIQQLLEHPLVNAKTTPASEGGVWAADTQGLMNTTHSGDASHDTADFCDFPVFPPCSGPGNLRADYVLPRKTLQIVDAGVFWPTPTQPFFSLTGFGFPVPSSDHRLVWVDVTVPSAR